MACLLLPNNASAYLGDATFATTVSDRTAAQTAIERIITNLHFRTVRPPGQGYARLTDFLGLTD